MSRRVKRKRGRPKKPPPELDPEVFELMPVEVGAKHPEPPVRDKGGRRPIPVPRPQYENDLRQIYEWLKQSRLSIRSGCFRLYGGKDTESKKVGSEEPGVEWYNSDTGESHPMPDPDSLQNRMRDARKEPPRVGASPRKQVLSEEDAKAKSPSPPRQSWTRNMTMIRPAFTASTSQAGPVAVGALPLSKILSAIPSWIWTTCRVRGDCASEGNGTDNYAIRCRFRYTGRCSGKIWRPSRVTTTKLHKNLP